MKKEKKGLFKKIKTFFDNINNKYFFGRYKGTYKYINKESNIKEYIIKFILIIFGLEDKEEKVNKEIREHRI